MNKPITPLASMEARLKATGVYRLAATDLVYLELCAYQSALSVLFEGVLELEREGFLSTAQDWGLAEAEWRYGLAADGLTAAERRRRVQRAEAQAAAGDWQGSPNAADRAGYPQEGRQGSGRMAYFEAAGTKISRSKADCAPT